MESKATVHCRSLGCPKNQLDSEVMLGSLALEGYAIAERLEDADVVVVNTCSFRALLMAATSFGTECHRSIFQIRSAQSEHRSEQRSDSSPVYGRQSSSTAPEVLKKSAAGRIHQPSQVPALHARTDCSDRLRVRAGLFARIAMTDSRAPQRSPEQSPRPLRSLRLRMCPQSG